MVTPDRLKFRNWKVEGDNLNDSLDDSEVIIKIIEKKHESSEIVEFFFPWEIKGIEILFKSLDAIWII